MINFKEYKEKKAAGLVVAVAAGDSFAVATQKFDPVTGVELPDEVIGVNMVEVTYKNRNWWTRLQT